VQICRYGGARCWVLSRCWGLAEVIVQVQRCRGAGAHVLKYRDTEEVQRFRGTAVQRCRGADLQRRRGAEVQRCRGAGAAQLQMCRGRGAGMQGCKDARMQGCRDAGVQIVLTKISPYHRAWSSSSSLPYFFVGGSTKPMLG